MSYSPTFFPTAALYRVGGHSCAAPVWTFPYRPYPINHLGDLSTNAKKVTVSVLYWYEKLSSLLTEIFKMILKRIKFFFLYLFIFGLPGSGWSRGASLSHPPSGPKTSFCRPPEIIFFQTWCEPQYAHPMLRQIIFSFQIFDTDQKPAILTQTGPRTTSFGQNQRFPTKPAWGPQNSCF